MAGQMGVETGIDLEKVLEVVRNMESVYGLKTDSHLSAVKYGSCCA
jgi:hypothetical protein